MNFKILDNTTKWTEWYVKDRNEVKAPVNGFYVSLPVLPNGEYQISERRNIVSEWRCFIENGKVIDCRKYTGDIMHAPELAKFPDWLYIQQIVKTYKQRGAYTTDVGVDDKENTFLIECHDFWSVGLYGFKSSRISYMFENAWKEILKKSNIFNYIKD